jgi:predicted DCC family thiol-disulfide oxidoreductase YuxK
MAGAHPRARRDDRLTAPMTSEPSWLVLYDAECGICRALLAGLLWWDRRGRLRPVALQGAEADSRLADLAPAERMATWHLVSPGGERWSAGAALPALLRLLPGGRAPASAFARFPRPTERGYRWVAEHRSELSRMVPARLKRRGDHLRVSPSGAARPGTGGAPRA